MSDPNCHDQRGHENVWLLLPWYVNGTLETAESQLVDEHLAACAFCREELGRCRGLSAALRSGEESAPSPHPIQLARLLERIDASERGLDRDEEVDRDHPDDADDRTALAGHAVWTSSERADRLSRTTQPERPERQARRQPDEHGQSAEQGGRGEGGGHLDAGGRPALRAERLGGHTGRAGRTGRATLFAATPRPVRIALAGQLAALLLLAAALAFSRARLVQPTGSYQGLRTPAADAPSAPTAAYHTLSAPSGDEGAAASRPQIRVVFAEGATEKQIREVLLRARGHLVDGPSPLGTYILEIPAPVASGAADRGALPGVAAAEPPTLPVAHAVPAYGSPPDSLAIVLSYLRGQTIVRFAEPVAGTSPAAGSAGAGGSPAAQRSPARARARTPELGTATGGDVAPAPP